MDKTKFLAELAGFEEYQEANPEAFQPTKAKRDRSQDVSVSAPKRVRDTQGQARATFFVKQAKKFGEVVKDSLAMALVDELNDNGCLLAEKCEEIETKVANMVTDNTTQRRTDYNPLLFQN